MRRSIAFFPGTALVTVLAMATLASASTTTTTTIESSTSTTLPSQHVAPVAPLTGRPDTSKQLMNRSALTIKIDNTPQAVPQEGVEDADDVYEEIVEGGITRLAAIFDSRIPAVVGPVRSVRRTDREIVFPIGGIFAFSGGAEYALKSIATAPVKLYSESNSGPAMFRDGKRYPPHNLFARAVLLMKKDGLPRPPPALFSYFPGSEQAVGPHVASFVVGFEEGYAATYTWDGKTGTWNRFLFDKPDDMANGVQLSPKNVVVMSVHYIGGVGVIDSYAQLIGSGPVEIFSDGTLRRGTWSRHSLPQRTIFRNAEGKIMDLAPGQTWVELMDVSEHVSITSAK